MLVQPPLGGGGERAVKPAGKAGGRTEEEQRGTLLLTLSGGQAGQGVRQRVPRRRFAERPPVGALREPTSCKERTRGPAHLFARSLKLKLSAAYVMRQQLAERAHRHTYMCAIG